MKNYPNLEEQSRRAVARKHAELKSFQSFLRECPAMNERYRGKAHEIADGLQPWIDALGLTLKP